MTGSARAAAAVLVVAALTVSCSESRTSRSKHPASQLSRAAQPSPELSPDPSAFPSVREAVETALPRVVMSDGRPRLARLSIPALGLEDLRVVPYRGRTDDAPGTRIQDGGVAASPYGPHGGVGPGGLGN